MSTLKSIATKALMANPSQVTRLEAVDDKAQYKAVSPRLAAVVADRAGCTVNRATWAIVDAYKATTLDDDEEVNEDF